jgi:hypothetical protein
MSELSNIVQVTISRETQAVTQPSFGIPAIVAEFATSKTTPAFDRFRYYGSLAEMTSEGWTSSDEVYKAAQAVFSQDPKVEKFMVGRKDATDADWATAFNLIQSAQPEWYAFSIEPRSGTEEDDIKEAMAWAETQKKIFFFSTDDTDAYDSGVSTDLGAFAQSNAYDRTVSVFHLDGDDTHIENAWQGECLPFDPGSQTWAYKTLSGIAKYDLTTAQQSNLFAKNYNIYTEKGGVNITQDGNLASGEYIDIIRGVDWLESRLEVEIYSNLVNQRKIPYDDGGIILIKGAVEAVLQEAERAGVLIPGTSVVTAPTYAEIPTNDVLNRILPDINFTALLQGAIHKVQINGTVTV